MCRPIKLRQKSDFVQSRSEDILQRVADRRGLPRLERRWLEAVFEDRCFPRANPAKQCVLARNVKVGVSDVRDRRVELGRAVFLSNFNIFNHNVPDKGAVANTKDVGAAVSEAKERVSLLREDDCAGYGAGRCEGDLYRDFQHGCFAVSGAEHCHFTRHRHPAAMIRWAIQHEFAESGVSDGVDLLGGQL